MAVSEREGSGGREYRQAGLTEKSGTEKSLDMG